MYQTRGSDHADTFQHHGARERESTVRHDDRPPPSAEQIIEDAVLSASSLRTSRLRIDAALARPCDTHCAPAGVHCWGGRASRVRGLCLARYAIGAGSPLRYFRDDPNGLADLAAATRRAQRDARIRLAVRHPNRHHITPQRTEVAQ